MAQRRHHYERAFEAYLRRTRVPYVAVNEARKALLPEKAALQITRAAPGVTGAGASNGAGGEPETLKSLDFVVYGQGGNLLVEIKGRKLPRRSSGPSRRLECWVQNEDVRALRTWAWLFGPEFEAVFVFVYWCDDQPPDGLFQEVFEYQGRWYALRSIGLDDYEASMKTRSPRWGTVDLPAPVYERLSRPFRPAGGWSASGDAGPMPPALEPIGA